MHTYIAIQDPAYMSSATFQLLKKDAFQWLEQQVATVCKQLNIELIPNAGISVYQQQFISHTASTLQYNIVRECLTKNDQIRSDTEWWSSDIAVEYQNDIIGENMLKLCLESPFSFISRKSQFIGYGLPNKLRPWSWKCLLEWHFNIQQVAHYSGDNKDASHNFSVKVAECRVTKPVQTSMDDLISKTTLQVYSICISNMY